MKIVDSGVVSPSFMDFTIPSTFAKENLIYLIQYGDFYCDRNYRIDKEYLDSFLFIYIKSGTLHVETRGLKGAAKSGQVVLLDCRFPHSYYCTDHVEFLWFHFQGNMVCNYPEFLFEKYKSMIMTVDSPSRIWNYFDRIFQYAMSYVQNEHMISLQVMKILAHLGGGRSVAVDNYFNPVIAYIRDHYSEDITLEDLMSISGMSKSHFIREFKKQVGSTPHEYLLAYRLRQSKQLLRSSAETIEGIAEDCGFNSASHFARAFKNENGMSPSEFRKIRF